MARILWMGDAGCHTGFARVTHSIGERLVADYGHEVSVLAVNYLGDYWPTNLRLYRPNKLSFSDIYGQTRILEMLAEVMPEAIVMLGDPVPTLRILFENKNDPGKDLLKGGPMGAPIITYVPVDGYNYPPRVVELLAKVTQVVLMSEHGKTVFPDAPVVHHGVDTRMYHPVSESSPMTASTGITVTSKKEAKAAFGFPEDSFLILRVDRNSFRKDFPSTWRSIIPVMKRHPNVMAHFHCGERGDYNLKELRAREPDLSSRFKFPEIPLQTYIGWPEENLAILYNAADLFVSTSWGEGFGLTLAEAAASGLPIVAQNVSAITEVVGPGGRLIEPQRLTATPMGHDQWLPNVSAFTDAIESLYDAGGSRRKLGEAGRDHVSKVASWDAAAADFNAIIQRSMSGPQAVAAVGSGDPGSAVQHRDEGPGGEGRGRRQSADPPLHSVIHG